MNDELLIERVRIRYHLSDDAVAAINRLREKDKLGASDAILQLGIISRRQLIDVQNEVPAELPSSLASSPDAHLLKTVEQSARPQFPIGIDAFELGPEIAKGGMGSVVHALDINLERPVAVKLLLDDQQQNSAWKSRFIQEAQVTGQLQHPNIIPVYCLGTTQEGRLYFAMKKVEGVTLHDVFRGLRAEEPQMLARFTRSKLLQTFQMVCMAVAYAHSRSVIHRDIKPANIMIGEFGEVFLMDWGLAKILEKAPEEGQARVTSVRDEQSRMTTRQGEAIGTPGYMAPELALGQLHLVAEQADVYALGAILYEILTLRRPYAGKDLKTIIQRMLRTPVIPARQRTPGRNIPEQLENIAGRCLERDVALRYKGVMDLYRELQGFVENHLGADLQKQGPPSQLEPAFDAYWETRRKVDALRSRLREDSELITPWSRLESKREVWQHKRDLERLEEELDQQFNQVIQGAKRILGGKGDTRSIVAEVGSALKTELSDASSSNRILQSERLIESFRRWSNLELGHGRLVIRVDRPNVSVEIARCDEIDGISATRPWQVLGIAPASIENIMPGSYMIRLSDQRHTYSAPITVPRIGDVTLDIEFSKLLRVPNGFVPILEKSVTLGGDAKAFWSHTEQKVSLVPFAMARYPVTIGEYLAFLNELAQTDLRTAIKRCPRSDSHRFLASADGQFSLPSHSPFNQAWDETWPVFGISWHDAQAYCEWLSIREGMSFRLPTSLEWEASGRGTDGRVYPWGNIWEPTFCNNALENPGEPTLKSVGNYPSDLSPFGVIDMAGGVAEWTKDLHRNEDLDTDLAICRGGSWNRTDRDARLASRHPMFPDAVSRRIGFRVALTL